MCLAYDEECFRVTTENVDEVSYLRYNQEEADTLFCMPKILHILKIVLS